MRDLNPRGLAPNPLSKSANRGPDPPIFIYACEADPSNAHGPPRTRTTETKTETIAAPSTSEDAHQECASGERPWPILRPLLMSKISFSRCEAASPNSSSAARSSPAS